MSTRALLAVIALSSWSLALLSCGAAAPPPEPAPPPPGVVASSPPSAGEPNPGPTSSAALTAAPLSTSSPRDPVACKLPAPKKSGDPCQTDADCGPSAPCHAPACVAKAKSPPRPPNMMCTMSFGCDTADANRCGCYDGSCALIPPT